MTRVGFPTSTCEGDDADHSAAVIEERTARQTGVVGGDGDRTVQRVLPERLESPIELTAPELARRPSPTLATRNNVLAEREIVVRVEMDPALPGGVDRDDGDARLEVDRLHARGARRSIELGGS
jgi:hypothetical protein